MSGKTDRADRAAAAREWRGGWRTVAAAMVGTSAGMQLFANVSSLFVKPLVAAFGWSRGEIAAMSAAVLLSALLLPVAGLVADRRGVRTLAACGAAVFAGCCVALAAMTGAVWQYVAIVAVMGVAVGPTNNVFLYARPIVAAFDRARGLALSLSLCGVPLAAFVLFPVLQHVIATFGWRAAFMVLAPFSVAAGAAAFVLLGRDAPASAALAAKSDASGHSFREAVGDPRLWLVLLAAVSVCLTTGFYVSSAQAMLSDKGVDVRVAAWLGSWYAVAAVGGRLTVGALLDRLPAVLVGAAALAAPAAALLAFYVAGPDQLFLLGLGVALFAVANGAEADVVCFLASRYFGLRAIGRLTGLLGAVSAVGIALGGVASGYGFDVAGTYDAVMLAGAAMSALAALAILASGWVRGRDEASGRAAPETSHEPDVGAPFPLRRGHGDGSPARRRQF